MEVTEGDRVKVISSICLYLKISLYIRNIGKHLHSVTFRHPDTCRGRLGAELISGAGQVPVATEADVRYQPKTIDALQLRCSARVGHPVTARYKENEAKCKQL